MTDHATKDRQAFILGESAKIDSRNTLAQKVAALRQQWHNEGRALRGEEVLARKMGWKVFEPKQTLRFLRQK
jgi:CDP-diacylglycerol pyrophosphatase